MWLRQQRKIYGQLYAVKIFCKIWEYWFSITELRYLWWIILLDQFLREISFKNSNNLNFFVFKIILTPGNLQTSHKEAYSNYFTKFVMNCAPPITYRLFFRDFWLTVKWFQVWILAKRNSNILSHLLIHPLLGHFLLVLCSNLKIKHYDSQ